MTPTRLSDYLQHIRDAAMDARSFTDGLTQEQFMRDKRTQRAVVMSLIIVGEAASQIANSYPEFANKHADVPWRQMRGMRNRIAHGSTLSST